MANKKIKEIDLFEDLTKAEKLEADIMGSIAVAIIEKRLSMGMTQTEFAKFLGVSQSMVVKWESCEYNFTIRSLVKITSLLNLNLNLQVTPKSA